MLLKAFFVMELDGRTMMDLVHQNYCFECLLMAMALSMSFLGTLCLVPSLKAFKLSSFASGLCVHSWLLGPNDDAAHEPSQERSPMKTEPHRNVET